MRVDELLRRRVTRRSVTGLLAGGAASVLLLACSLRSEEDDDDSEVTEDDDLEQDDDEEVDQDPDSEDDEGADDDVTDDDPDPAPDAIEADDSEGETVVEEDPEEEAPEPRYVEDPDVSVLLGSVIDYRLSPEGEWDGAFGSVTLHLHHGWVDGEDVTFIRTDASNVDFARRYGLVHAPMLSNALAEPDSHGILYLFEGGPSGQLPVFSTSPAEADLYSGLFRVVQVMIAGKTAVPIATESEIYEAEEIGNVVLFETETVVNYPHVTWPGGQIPVDAELVEAIGGGQLIDEPDLENREVTFKLHQSAPGNRYIITTTSDPDSETAQSSAVGHGSELLADAGAATQLAVFASGDDGPGLLGHQHEVSSAEAGDEDWSPISLWQTVEWSEGAEIQHVDDFDELSTLADEGELEIVSGAPGHETLVLNCPVPILAAVDVETDD